MAEQNLTGLKIKDTYEGLLHVDGGLSTNSGAAAVKKVYDGVGKSTCLNIAKDFMKVAGDVNIASGSASVYIRSGSAAIELADGGGSDNPYIDFKTSGSEDYDCRIIKSSNGLQIHTGGNSNQKICAAFESDQGFRVYGRILLGKNTGDGLPAVSLDATRVGQLDKLKLHGNDVVSLYTAGTAESNVKLTATTTGVGIGTTNPAKKLHVNGSLRLQVGGTEAAGKVLTCTNTSGDVEWADPDSGGDIYDEIKIIPPNGVSYTTDDGLYNNSVQWETTVEIPKGYKATHVTLYGNIRLRCEVYEGKISDEYHTLVARADANQFPGSGIANPFITQVTSTSVNFLHFVLKDTLFGGGNMRGASIRIQKV
jgi:hypothetical protein